MANPNTNNIPLTDLAEILNTALDQVVEQDGTISNYTMCGCFVMISQNVMKWMRDNGYSYEDIAHFMQECWPKNKPGSIMKILIEIRNANV